MRKKTVQESEQKLKPFSPELENQQNVGFTIITHDRELHVYRITEDELNNLQEAGNYKTLDLSMLATCGSIFLSLVCTLLTVEIINIKTLSIMTSICFVSFLGTLFFGARTRLAWKSAKVALNKITGKMA